MMVSSGSVIGENINLIRSLLGGRQEKPRDKECDRTLSVAIDVAYWIWNQNPGLADHIHNMCRLERDVENDNHEVFPLLYANFERRRKYWIEFRLSIHCGF